jgi:A/G-specific adenine glycosylase
VLLRRRPEEGLLGGMMEFPSTDWRATPWDDREAESQAPVAAQWERLPGLVRHGFTHFELELVVLSGRVAGKVRGVWCAIDRLSEMALPTLMKKVVRHALGAVGKKGAEDPRPRQAGQQEHEPQPDAARQARKAPLR